MNMQHIFYPRVGDQHDKKKHENDKYQVRITVAESGGGLCRVSLQFKHFFLFIPC